MSVRSPDLVECDRSLRNAPPQLSVRCLRYPLAGDDGRLSAIALPSDCTQAIAFDLRQSDRVFVTR
jgi:hypothetical protein